jgi:flagellar basal-body rod protein FlgF
MQTRLDSKKINSSFYRSQGAENSLVKIDGSYTIHKQGDLEQTNNAFDLGLSGNGFFEVLTPNGVRYTRKGSFTVNKAGELVTTQGFKVLQAAPKIPEGETAQAVVPPPEQRVIKLANGRFSVNFQGAMFQNGQQLGELAVVEFRDTQALRKEGNSLFINPESSNISNLEGKTAVRQGTLEQSNVNAIQEMSELIKAHRQFESIQKGLKAYDNIAGRSVNEIGKF